MPLYEYQCDACGVRFERIQRFADPPIDRCPSCGQGPVHKLLSASALHFKGTGWYVTDYARKNSAGAPEPAAPGSTPPAASSGSADDKKPASGGETKPAQGG
jgi:putative FmdB family regulatory protein